MRRDWRRYMMTAAVVLTTALTAVGCGNGGREEGSSAETTEETAGTESAAESEPEKETDHKDAVVEEFQIVPGYGIVGKQNPQVFVMSNQDTPTARRDNIAVELESVVYQDGLWIVRTRVQDFSVEIIPDEEAARIAEDEKKNMNRDGGVERKGYFCYNDAMHKYARSLYNDEYGENISGSMAIMGTGLDDSGVRFHAYGASYNYEQLERDGSLTYLNEAKAEGKKLEQQIPEGTYELKIAGFDESIKFEMEPAKTYENLTDIDGGHDIDGFSVVVQTKKEGDLLGVVWMIDEQDPCRIMPQTFEPDQNIVLKGEKGEYPLTKKEILGRSQNYDLKGLTRNGQARTLWFDVPADEQSGTFTLVLPGVVMFGKASAEPVMIPVPEKEEADISETVELDGCTLKLTHVRKMPEPMKTGMAVETGSGEEGMDTEVKKPALYLTASLESKDPEKEAVTVAGYREDPEAKPYERFFLQNDSDGGAPEPYGRLKGFYLFYDEGESQIPVRFAYPLYYWHKDLEIEIPVAD